MADEIKETSPVEEKTVNSEQTEKPAPPAPPVPPDPGSDETENPVLEVLQTVTEVLKEQKEMLQRVLEGPDDTPISENNEEKPSRKVPWIFR